MSDTEQTVVPEKISTGKQNKSKVLTRWRRLTQVIFLAIIGQWSFYGIFRCPFIVPYVSCQNCPVITCHGRLFTIFWGFWLLLPVSIVLFGRVFCGWICPGGFLSQLFGMLAPVKLRIKTAFTNILRYLKYIALGFSLYAYFIMGQPREAIPIRTGDFFNSVYLTFEHADTIWLIRTFIVLGFLVLGLLMANIWCRFLCPTGGILDLLKSFSLFKIYKTEDCNECDKCLDVCHMGTRPAESNCTNCCDCSGVCPQSAIKIGRQER